MASIHFSMVIFLNIIPCLIASLFFQTSGGRRVRVKRSQLRSCRDDRFFVSALPQRNAFQDAQYSVAGNKVRDHDPKLRFPLQNSSAFDADLLCFEF